MSSPAPNPLITRGSMKSMPPDPSPLSPHKVHMAGISVSIYGLDLLPPPPSPSSSSAAGNVAVVWLLHPRLQRAESMGPVAGSVVRGWYERMREGEEGDGKVGGVLAVAFDQRNHGDRLVDAVANEAWKQGNARHGVDMFSIYNGTARDTSLLMDYLPAYIFPTGSYTIAHHIVLGISLGGHAAWQCVVGDPRVSAAVVVIGCPDYTRLMADRAAKSRLASYTSTDPPGCGFVGSEDFPRALVEAVEKYDPAALLLGELDARNGREPTRDPDDGEKARLVPLMRDRLGGKRILCLSGGKDKLVPYECSRPFLTWLKRALAHDGGDDDGASSGGGWFAGHGTELEDIIDPEAGHEYSDLMREQAVRFICETLSEERQTPAIAGVVRDSKM